MDRCRSASVSFKHQEYRLVADVPAPEPYTVREHIINIYHCKRCNSEVRPEVYSKARYAWKESFSNDNCTMGCKASRWIVYMLEAVYGLKLSAGTINKALVSVSESLQPFVSKARSNINNSKSAGFDGTGISVNGSKGWVWAAVSGNRMHSSQYRTAEEQVFLRSTSMHSMV